MALPVPDFGDVHEDDRVRTSALIWLALVAILFVLGMLVRAAV